MFGSIWSFFFFTAVQKIYWKHQPLTLVIMNTFHVSFWKFYVAVLYIKTGINSCRSCSQCRSLWTNLTWVNKRVYYVLYTSVCTERTIFTEITITREYYSSKFKTCKNWRSSREVKILYWLCFYMFWLHFGSKAGHHLLNCVQRIELENLPHFLLVIVVTRLEE